MTSFLLSLLKQISFFLLKILELIDFKVKLILIQMIAFFKLDKIMGPRIGGVLNKGMTIHK